eukprot:1571493-Prymnesium_polylepis.1
MEIVDPEFRHRFPFGPGCDQKSSRRKKAGKKKNDLRPQGPASSAPQTLAPEQRIEQRRADDMSTGPTGAEQPWEGKILDDGLISVTEGSFLGRSWQRLLATSSRPAAPCPFHNSAHAIPCVSIST